MTQLLLRTCRIGKVLQGRPVLDDVTLSIRAGESICLIGESGAGKTTLLRCLNLLEHIDEGFIEYGGHRVIAGDPPTGPAPTVTTGTNGAGTTNGNGNGHAHANGGTASAASATRRKRAAGRRITVNENHFRRKFGAVLDGGCLLPSRTVLENVVEGPLHVLRQKRRDVTARAREWLIAVGLSERADAYPGDLTVAERRRAALARALVMKPEVLLLDEITMGLYPTEAAALLDTVATARSLHNAATVMVTHHLEFVLRFADKVCFMEGGRITQQGPPEPVLRHPGTDGLRTFIGAVRAAR
jgi:polar amino acid transport system ATP-binding protein